MTAHARNIANCRMPPEARRILSISRRGMPARLATARLMASIVAASLSALAILASGGILFMHHVHHTLLRSAPSPPDFGATIIRPGLVASAVIV